MTGLVVEHVSKSFRGVRAVSDASFEVEEGAIVALVGPNGAGKTTIFNLIAGAQKPTSGRILLGTRVISGLRADEVCRQGVGRTFQLVKPFGGLTVLENVTVGALLRERSTAAARERARAVVEQLGLSAYGETAGGSLTLAQRRRLEVARAVATRPRLLLLDEMMAGLRPGEVDEMVGVLQGLRRELGISILLVEHVMRAVAALAERVVVLHHGEVVASGSPAEVVKDPAVVASYLGDGVIH